NRPACIPSVARCAWHGPKDHLFWRQAIRALATTQNLARESALKVSVVKRHKVLRAHLLLLPAYLWLVLFFLCPLLIIVSYSLTVRTPTGGSEAVLTFEHYARLWDPLYARILWRSLWLALATTVITIVMAYPF